LDPQPSQEIFCSLNLPPQESKKEEFLGDISSVTENTSSRPLFGDSDHFFGRVIYLRFLRNTNSSFLQTYSKRVSKSSLISSGSFATLTVYSSLLGSDIVFSRIGLPILDLLLLPIHQTF
jgi:hypothetical protein